MAAKLPEPEPGLVFRYDYTWWLKAGEGLDQGKDRPACLAVVADPLTSPRFGVILPITHSPPSDDVVAVEIPAKVKAAIGLDHDRSWIVVSEYNVDQWPKAGICTVPGRNGELSYGFLPPGLFRKVREAFAATIETNRARRVDRT